MPSWKVRHPDITVQLIGRNGNAGAIMCAVVDAIRSAGREGDLTAAETRTSISEFRAEAMSGDYDHLLRTCMRWVNVE